MRFTTEQLQSFADALARYGWSVGRDIGGKYYAQAETHNVALGETKGEAGTHLLAMLAATEQTTTTTTEGSEA